MGLMILHVGGIIKLSRSMMVRVISSNCNAVLLCMESKAVRFEKWVKAYRFGLLKIYKEFQHGINLASSS